MRVMRSIIKKIVLLIIQTGKITITEEMIPNVDMMHNEILYIEYYAML